MPFLSIPSDSPTGAVELHYEDYGTGRPVVLIHGWPLSARSWEGQVPALVEAGYRVISYDRRGFGASAQPWSGYDYDTFAADLHALLEELDLQDAVLVGFSMGGGELARYVGTYGEERIGKLVFASAVPPYLWKSEDNPDGGVDQELADWFTTGLTEDRPAFLAEFLGMFFTAGKQTLLNKPLVSRGADRVQPLHRARRLAEGDARLHHGVRDDGLPGRSDEDHRPDARHPRRLRHDRPLRSQWQAHGRGHPDERDGAHRGRPARCHRVPPRGVEQAPAGVPGEVASTGQSPRERGRPLSSGGRPSAFPMRRAQVSVLGCQCSCVRG
ncbi:alpha/beta fold hydrolase [uncultured Arthrobacter sp.]|uniref:alpha/beta fold hydrolase n=1 Tax=uncultured Arthrobacter sp. TaxID=114050 RepID=UPI00263540DF|nr:alpha/beta hydrolase [uncultured Arthrobacter sp.]